MPENKFEIGDIVTLKSHPLAFQSDGRIDASINQIPPFMCVKEIHIEKKKQKFSQDSGSVQIADNVKYLCVYFNQHRMIFEEKFVYQSVLISIDDIIFHSDSKKKEEGDLKLVDETKSYNPAKYEFGKRIFFKTYKLEKRKKFGKSETEPKFSTKSKFIHTSPAFVINGYKKNAEKTLHNPKTGKLQRQCSEELFKVVWYNAYQEKFSEDYLPKEFFTDDVRIYSSEKVSKASQNGELSKEKS